MVGKKIKVLIVDDSALMRRHLMGLFQGDAGFDVEAARNGKEALEMLESFDPDVVTLDVNMPEMDGLTCLSHIMVKRPKPVVMVSSLTEKGAEATFEALHLGAVDFVHKPSGTISLEIRQIERDLLDKVRNAASIRLGTARKPQDRPPSHGLRRAAARPVAASTAQRDGMSIVLIGASTGGPGALEEVLPPLPEEFPAAVVVAQHMPRNFTAVFAKRIASYCRMPVSELDRQTLLEPGHIYIARGDADVLFKKTGLGIAALPAPASSQYLWHPSVTAMVESCMTVSPSERLIGVMLTGMGNDGAAAMAQLRRSGGRTIAQDEATSVVFGMPGELVRAGGADLVLPCRSIARQLVGWTLPTIKSASIRR